MWIKQLTISPLHLLAFRENVEVGLSDVRALAEEPLQGSWGQEWSVELREDVHPSLPKLLKEGASISFWCYSTFTEYFDKKNLFTYELIRPKYYSNLF